MRSRFDDPLDGSKLSIEQLGKREPPTAQEEKELIRLYKNGSMEARDELVLRNGRLIIFWARKYWFGQTQLIDLCNEGVIGFLNALEKFDPETGNRLSTYVTWWIRQAISRAAGQHRTIRLPVHMVERRRKIKSAKRRLVLELGREPTVEEIAQAIGEKPGKVLVALEARDAIELEHPWGDDGTLADKLGEEIETSVDIEFTQTRLEIEEALGRLTAKEERILRIRFGLTAHDSEAKTLEEIAAKYGLTRERIRQIQNQALVKMKRWVSKENLL